MFQNLSILGTTITNRNEVHDETEKKKLYIKERAVIIQFKYSYHPL
jgi:hypothetical protein